MVKQSACKRVTNTISIEEKIPKCSRIFVKDLPLKVTEDEVRKHFSECGTITDIRLLKRQDGGFRRLAIVGYTSEQEAEAAIKLNNRSFIQNSRLTVSPYQVPDLKNTVESASWNKPRPWSKYSQGSSAYQRLHLNDNAAKAQNVENGAENDRIRQGKHRMVVNDLLDDLKEDENFERFLYDQDPDLLDRKRSYQKSIKGTDGEDGMDEQSKSSRSNETEKVSKFVKRKRQYMTAFKLKIEGVPYKYTEKKVRALFKTVAKPKYIRILHDSLSRAPTGIALAWFKTEDDLNKALKLDKTRIGKRYLRLNAVVRDIDQMKFDSCSQLIEAVEDRKDQLNKNELCKAKDHRDINSTKPEENKATIGNVVIIKNLWYGCTEEQLTNLVSPFGGIDSIQLPLTKSELKPKGFAIITFTSASSSIKAINTLDGTIFQGRLIKVETSNRYDCGESNFSTSSNMRWNTLFISPDIIAERLAKRFNLNKRDVYTETGGESLPVRLAAAEADIVDKTRSFLIAHGVRLDVLDGCDHSKLIDRSKRILIAKNVDIGQVGSLKKRVLEFGVINKWIFPPEGTGGIVEYARAEDALRFIDEASSQFTPILFEFAPTEILIAKTNEMTVSSASKKSSSLESAIVYVKGLNYSTTNAVLETHFETIGNCKAQIAYNCVNGKRISMGTAFVTFEGKTQAHNAIKTMQNCSLDGHRLELSISSSRNTKSKVDLLLENRTTGNSQVDEDSATKICVRNIPFQVTENEIEKLFSIFGQLRSVRLPKKVDGGHRGFGFVDFTSRNCAKAAFDSLSPSTHMFGRRLVLEWANSNDFDAIELHRKSARYFEASILSNTQPKSTSLKNEVIQCLKQTQIE